MLKLLATAALLSAQATTPPAPPAAPLCLTRQQISDIGVVMMASTLETVRNACRPHLQAAAWLATPAAAESSARLRGEARQRLASAIAGLTRMFGGGMDAAAIRGFTEAGLAAGVGAEFSRYVNPAICGDANEILEISTTLTPDQMGRFFGAFASLADNFIRMIPPGAFGPDPHPPALFPTPPAPPAATPPPPPTPAAFELQRGARRPAPAPAPEIAPPPPSPPRPFLCRDGE